MSITYGFYNSLNGDRKYDAVQISKMFDGLVTDGVYAHVGEFFVIKATNGNTITVGSGRSWFSHTWTVNDAAMQITLDPSDLLTDRYDVMVIEHNFANRINTVKCIKGVSSSTPIVPVMINNASIRQIPLGVIFRKALAAGITQSDITNKVGTSECPFSTAVLQSVSIDAMTSQWNSQWAQQLITNQAGFTTWFNQIKGQLSTDAAGNLQNQINNIPITTPLQSYRIGDIIQSTNPDNPGLTIGGTWVALTDKFLVGAGTVFAAGLTGGVLTHNHTTPGMTLTTAQIPLHGHAQDAHNHSQYAHAHTQDAHAHSTVPHSHAQASHSHSVGMSTLRYTFNANGNSFSVGNGGSAGTFETQTLSRAISAESVGIYAAQPGIYGTTASNYPAIATNQGTGGGTAHAHGDTGVGSNLPPYKVVYMWERTA